MSCQGGDLRFGLRLVMPFPLEISSVSCFEDRIRIVPTNRNFVCGIPPPSQTNFTASKYAPPSVLLGIRLPFKPRELYGQVHRLFCFPCYGRNHEMPHAQCCAML